MALGPEPIASVTTSKASLDCGCREVRRGEPNTGVRLSQRASVPNAPENALRKWKERGDGSGLTSPPGLLAKRRERASVLRIERERSAEVFFSDRALTRGGAQEPEIHEGVHVVRIDAKHLVKTHHGLAQLPHA